MTETADPSAGEVRILLRDEHLVAVAKPAGMLVHRGMGADRSETFLLQSVRDAVGARVHAVHRLDRPTCGVVLFATGPEAARALQESWKAGLVRKTYHGVARGWLAESAGIREEALDDPDTGNLQEAATRWFELERIELPWESGAHPTARFSLLELEPRTGRWHQIRRHLSRMAHPLVGDTVHGDRRTNHLVRDRLGFWRLLLWARTLEFPHPAAGETVRVEDDGAGIRPFWDALREKAIRP